MLFDGGRPMQALYAQRQQSAATLECRSREEPAITRPLSLQQVGKEKMTELETVEA
jgi:hypothetical protein